VNPQLSSWLPTLVAVPLVGFVLYRRLRRTFGRQSVTPKRMALRMALLFAVCVLLFVQASATAASLGAAAAGLVLGVALATVGLMHTRVESTADGKFYTPNKWIGLAVTALFLGRLAGRLFTISERAAQVSGTSPFPGIQGSRLTLGLFFLLAGYYVTYYAGVLKKTTGLDVPSQASRLS
jgi:hypothetical protein